MPYIAIKAYPKDEETKKKLVDKINEDILAIWGCPQEAITISLEEVAPADWQNKVVARDITEKKEHMMLLDGKKLY